MARALQAGSYTPAESKRVRAVPDTRTIRYYTTLGLIDRPIEMSGRTALYGDKHVLQLVAIKRLQAKKLTLSDIQQQLVGATEKKLRELATLPTEFWQASDRYLEKSRAATVPAPHVEPTPYELAEPQFWAEQPALPGAGIVSKQSHRSQKSDVQTQGVKSCLRLALTNELELLISSHDLTVGNVDLQGLQAAAAPLLKELAHQGLLSNQQTTEQDYTRPPARDHDSTHH